MQLGKFSSDRDSALHYLCIAEWCNESFGDVEAPTGYVWRITNSANDVFGSYNQGNMEFDSILEDWFTDEGDVKADYEFLSQLVGHFLVVEVSTGAVYVVEYPSETALRYDFNKLQGEYDDWATQSDDPVFDPHEPTSTDYWEGPNA